jgi:NADH-quinone oxidoreductase subunit M
MLLAGVMAKIGIYGLVRILLPFFPQQVVAAADIILILGLIGVVGGALVALAQDDAKRMLAWSSLSHLSLVVIGVFSLDVAGLTGVPVQMVAHGLSIAALFLLVGHLEARAASRGLDDFGGLAERAPRLAVLFVIAALASAGLPGTANFVGEFLLLWGAFKAFGLIAAAIAGLSVIIGAVYLLRVVQRWMYGIRPAHLDRFDDLGAGECLAVAPLLLLALYFGFHPRPIIAQTTAVMSALSAPARTVKTPPPTSTKPESAPAPAPAPASVAIPSPVAAQQDLRIDQP